jgi:serine O-acetyltransferase
MAYGSGHGSARVVDFGKHDPMLARLRLEAEEAIEREADLGAFMFANVLNHDTLEAIVVHRVAVRLENRDLPSDLIRQTYMDVVSQDASIGEAFRADAMAVFDRDPACTRLIEPFLYFKGFHAGRRDFALYLQSRASEVFQVDINPAALIGKGIFLDHATGIVIGSTAVVEDDVSMLQGVTLGGTGKEVGDRHPKIRHGVLLGAGAKVLGNIEVGHCSRVASGSVVLQAVPHNKTVAGVPARVVGEAGCAEPARSMDQIIAAKPTETAV